MTEHAWLEVLRLWIIQHPGWAGIIIFLVAFTESIVIVGILIPGIMILFALGALIGLGLLDFYLAWVTATAGAILGDSFSYWLGHRYRDSLRSRWPFRRWPELLHQGQDLFQRRGVVGVVIGRFVGPLRPIVPVVAGMLGMSPRVFYPTAIIAGIAWSPAYLIPGVVLGASLDVASAYTLRLGVLLAIVALITWLVTVVVRGVYRSLTRRTPWLLKRSVSALRRHPRLARYIGPLVIPARGDVLSIAMLGIVMVASLTVVTGALLYVVIPGTPDLDYALHAGALALRNHVADLPFLFSLFIGDWRVLALSAAGLFVWLLWRGRTLAAWHWLAAIAGAPLLALLMQGLLRWLPAWPSGLMDWGRYPDLASVFIAAVLGFYPVLLARDLRAHQRKWIYLATAFLIMMALIARLYFHLAAFSGVVSALLLTTIWTAIVGIGFRVRATAWHHARPPLMIFGGLFLLSLTVLLTLRGPETLQQLTPVPETQLIANDAWREQAWRTLPQSRSFAATVPGEILNLQWRGDLADIRDSLDATGWHWQETAPGPLQVLNILHPAPQSENLPLFLKDHQGRAAAALAYKALSTSRPSLAEHDNVTDGPTRLAVVRFWDSGLKSTIATTSGDETRPIWLGEAVLEEVRVYGWWFTAWFPVAQANHHPSAPEVVLADTPTWEHQAATDTLWLIWQEPNESSAQPDTGDGS